MTLRRRTLAAFGRALLLTGSAALAVPKPAGPIKTYPTGAFVIAGTPVSAKDVLDARTLPDMKGKPSLMITLAPAIAATLAKIGTPRLACTLDGKPIGDSPTDALAADHALQLSGDFGDYNATAALARRISGRDPLPDAESDE